MVVVLVGGGEEKKNHSEKRVLVPTVLHSVRPILFRYTFQNNNRPETLPFHA